MNRILWIYNLIFPLALVAAAPWWLLRMATTARYREGLAERLGRIPERFLRTRDDRDVLWVHAVSVGEVMAVVRLIHALDAALPQMRVVLSTTTRTGQQIARARLGEERVFYCPLDIAWATRAWLRALRPKLLVLVETEFWPGLMHACFRRGIPVMAINARISDRSWPRYRRLRIFWKPLLSRMRESLAQSDLDAERLRALGCRGVKTIGNLKYDLREEANARLAQLLRRLAPALRWVVAGSTLEGEEKGLIEAWKRLTETRHDLALLLAPRHLERFAAVGRMLNESGTRWRRRSELTEDAQPVSVGEVILLDTIGELAAAYSLGTVAFVGGSVARAGGHNPLEPAIYAVPAVMGPHVENFRAIVADLRAEDAILVTQSEEFEEVRVMLEKLLDDEASASALGERARRILARHAGATMRTVDAICNVLQTGTERQS